MKKFKLYQIQMTNEIVDAVNAGKTVPAYSAKMKMSMDLRGTNIGNLAGDAFAEEYYTHVSTITAEDLTKFLKLVTLVQSQTSKDFHVWHPYQ